MNGNVYLTGFMGVGKTTIGRLVADAFRRRFVDMDAELARRFGMPITEVFATQGEQRFRDAETALLDKLAKETRLVIATGGGLPEKIENRTLMRSTGKVVQLAGELSTCTERLSPAERASRPLWQDEQALEALYRRRIVLYADADLTVAVDRQTPESIARLIVSRLLPERRITVRLGNDASRVIVTQTAERTLSEVLPEEAGALITDSRVADLHLDRLTGGHRFKTVVTMKPGEAAKSWNNAERVFQQLLEHRVDRDDVLVAIGGGVVSDLGAFVAATYKRGIRFHLVSTTLVGCVDAAVGGKAAVNIGRTKNVVGSFTVPESVILDTAAMRTLKPAQLREGLIEAYKTGLIRHPALAELVERDVSALLGGDVPLLHEVVVLSASAKADVVSSDFQENDLRGILNFGHTYGHAVEGYHRYRVSHGKAVAVGMLVALEISRSRGLLAGADADRMEETTLRLSPDRVAMPPLDEAWEIMMHDKKRKAGSLVFVLLKGTGKTVFVRDVTREELAGAVKRVEERVYE